MDKPLFFDGQNITKNDIEAVTDAIENESENRLLAVTSQRGAVSGLVVSNLGGNTLQVTAGYGYTESAERVEFLVNQSMPVLLGDVGKYLVVQHTTTDGTPIAHPVTGALNDTRRVNVSTLLLVTFGSLTPDDLILCSITAIDNPSAGQVLIDESVRQSMAGIIPTAFITDAMMDPASEVSKHADKNNINFYQGTGSGWSVVNPHNQHIVDFWGGSDIYNFATQHQQRMHHGGIVDVAGDYTALTPSITTSPLLDLSVIPVGSYLHVNGQTLTAIPSLQYNFGAAPLSDQFYLVMLDSTGAFVISTRATWTQNLSDCWVSWISQGTTTGVGKVLAFTFATSELSWDGGPSVPVVVNGGRYRLLAVDGVNYIEVEVGATLPGIDASNTITVNALPVMTDKALICTVCRTALGTLLATTLRDYRSFGTLGHRELSNRAFNYDLEQPISKAPELQFVAELMAGFVVSGFEAPVPPVSTALSVNGGVCWVNGRRLTVSNSVHGVPALVDTYYIFVNSSGSVLVDDDDLRGQPGKEREYLLLYVAVSDGTSWTSVQDQRNFAQFGSLTHPVLENGHIGGPPTFEYGLNVEAGGVVTLPSGPDTLVGQVVYEDNLDPGLVIQNRKNFVSAFNRLFGEGTGDVTLSPGVTSVGIGVTEVEYRNLTIPNGATLTGDGPFLKIAVAGILTIQNGGLISLVGKGGVGGIGLAGTVGAGGGVGVNPLASAGGNGMSPLSVPGVAGKGVSGGVVQVSGGGGGGGGNSNNSTGGGGGGGGGGKGGGGGGVGSETTTFDGNSGSRAYDSPLLGDGSLSEVSINGLQRLFNNGSVMGWGGGGGAGTSPGGHIPGSGGNGGGALYIEAKEIIFGNVGVLVNVSGVNGVNGSGIFAGGGGGGGGGSVLIVGGTWTGGETSVSSLARILADGGSGGARGGGASTTVGNGGNGAKGVKINIDLSNI